MIHERTLSGTLIATGEGPLRPIVVEADTYAQLWWDFMAIVNKQHSEAKREKQETEAS